LTFGAIIGLGYSKRNQLDDEENAGISNNVIQNPLFGTVISPTYVAPNPYADGVQLFNAIGQNSSGNRTWILQDNINGGVKTDLLN
jgi:hypothetical protein